MTGELPAVLVVYNLPRVHERTAEGVGVCLESDAGVLEELAAVTEALGGLGVTHRSVGFHRLDDLRAVLASASEPVVFNLVEDLDGPHGDAAFVPALCRAFGKACTGGDSRCLSLSTDKWLSKAVLTAYGIACPQAAIIAPGEAIPDGLPPGLLIVKPACQDASEGIGPGSVVKSSSPQLLHAVEQVHRQFGQPAMVEQFIDGREINVSLLEQNGRVEVLPIAEIDFSAFGPDQPRIVDYRAKWVKESFEFRNTPRVIPARLEEEQARRVRFMAMAAWHAVGCRDCARVDFRMDGQGNALVLEVNPNPDISLDAGFPAALQAAGIEYRQFIGVLISSAAERLTAVRGSLGGEEDTASSPGMAEQKPPDSWRIRRSRRGDRDEILQFLAATSFFRGEELAVAREVLEDALIRGPSGHYQSFTAEQSGRAVGWVCYGPTPCTEGTFDIYWLAVTPDLQGKGLGKALVSYAERLIVGSGGRLAIVETSGRKSYDPTRGFYAKMGYQEAASIAHFYAPQDNKVVYVKHLGRT